MKQPHATKLRQVRELRGWSRVYIAEQVEVDIATVGRWERGERMPHPHYRQKLCELFAMSASDLGLLSETSGERDDRATVSDLQPQISSAHERDAKPSLGDEQIVPASHPAEASPPNVEIVLAESRSSRNKPLPLRSQQNRQRMLRKMSAFWINGVLKQSLHGANLVIPDFKELPNAVTDPWMVTLQHLETAPMALPSDMHISQIYDETDGELLILGEPGSGKTTLLLELARILLERAAQEETAPIPIMFNLVSWAIKRPPLDHWLVEELCCKYQVPRKLAQAWVQTEQILPLLDGLDEVALQARSACIETINAYRQKHGLQPMVVCSRLSDYFGQSARLLLRRGVIVQPLNAQQIDAYFFLTDEKLTALRYALKVDPTLQELATSPLMLSILALTYQESAVDIHSEPLPLEVRRCEVFATYVEHMLTHRKGKSYYTAEQTVRWLAWLARQLVQQQQAEFYIERMQPEWLLDPKAIRWYTRLLVGLLMGLLGGTIGMLADVPLYEMIHAQLFEIFTHTTVSNLQCAETLPAFGTIATSLDSLVSLPVVGLLYGIGFGMFGGVISCFFGCKKRPHQSLKAQAMWVRLSHYGFASLFGLGCGAIFMFINLLWVPCPFHSGLYDQVAEELAYGLCGVFIGGLAGGLTKDMFGVGKYQVQPVEVLVWSCASLRRHVTSFLLGGSTGVLVGIGTELFSEVYLKFSSWQQSLPISALISGLLGAVIGVWIGGFSQHALEKRSFVRPNEGTRRSMRNGLIIATPIGLALSSYTFGLVLWLDPANLSDGLLWCIPLGLIVATILFLLNGGYACLQHCVLRFVLYMQGYMPWNYVRFLDEATEKLLLRKVGGGYIFIHRLLLDYFAFSAPDTHESFCPPETQHFPMETQAERREPLQ